MVSPKLTIDPHYVKRIAKELGILKEYIKTVRAHEWDKMIATILNIEILLEHALKVE